MSRLPSVFRMMIFDKGRGCAGGANGLSWCEKGHPAGL